MKPIPSSFLQRRFHRRGFHQDRFIEKGSYEYSKNTTDRNPNRKVLEEIPASKRGSFSFYIVGNCHIEFSQKNEGEKKPGLPPAQWFLKRKPAHSPTATGLGKLSCVFGSRFPVFPPTSEPVRSGRSFNSRI